MSVFELIHQYNGSIAVLVAVLVAASGFFHYLSTRRAEEKGKQYDRYHQLLQDLNTGEGGSKPFVDRQVAVVYELRNFPEYWPVTLRILENSLPRWRDLYQSSRLVLPAFGSTNNLYLEASLTIGFIKRRQLEKSYLCIDEEDR